MMSIVGNSGKVVVPHLIYAIEDKPVNWYSYGKSLKIDQDVFKTVQKGMRATVASYSGTAHALHIDDLYIAGKTGTAQSSGDKEDHAWFVGYVKSEKRNVAFSVFLEHGGSSHNECLLAREFLIALQEEKVL